MISTSAILTSLHTFGAIVLIVLSVLAFLSGIRRRSSRSIAILLLVYALASVSLGLAFSSLTPEAVAPWLTLLVISTYPIAAAALLVSIIILRPEFSRKFYIRIPLWIVIIGTTVIVLMDAFGVSAMLFTQNFLVSYERLQAVYTGGYTDLNTILTVSGGSILRLMLIIFYALNSLVHVIVLIQDWKKDKENLRKALILGITGILATITSTVLNNFLPMTLAALLSNGLLSAGYFIVNLQISAEGKDPENTWLQNILEDHPIFTKMMASLALVVLPAIAFLSFSTFSFFQTGLITSSENNLNSLSIREAGLVSENLSADLNLLVKLQTANRTSLLLEQRAIQYIPLSEDQIRQEILEFNDRWANGDELLTSSVLDPAINVDLRNVRNRYPQFRSLILTDRYGGLITATEEPVSYSYMGQNWLTHISENQTPYIGNPVWSEVENTYLMPIAVPLFSEDGDLAGAIFVQYDLNQILPGLDVPSGLQIGYGIATPLGKFLPSTGLKEDEVIFPNIALTPQSETQTWRVFRFLDDTYLIETNPVVNSGMGFTTPWFIVAYQPVSEVLSPLAFAQTTTVVVAIVITLLSALLVLFLTQSIVNPIESLRSAAEQIQKGVRGVVTNVTSRDEFGSLAKSFNQMSEELNQVLTNLESNVADRTKDLQRRTTQLEASAKVAREAAGARDLTTLLNTTSELVSKSFGYYHCGIFLLDEAENFAVLQASNSEGGRKMLARGHKLQVGRVGVVGYCADTGTPRIAQDVGTDVTYYANPDMPETRSEMALPLIVRGKRIGVLDIQSTEANAFSEDDTEILQVLADQLALAIDNTRLLESSQKALDELQVLYGQQTALAWRSRLAEDELAFAYDSTGMTRSGGQQTPASTDNSVHLKRPISFRGQMIGELDFQRDENEGQWTDEEAQLIEEILEQTALALENARLVQQIRLRSDQIRLLQEITAMAASILNEQQLLEQVAEKLRTSLELQHCGIVLREPDPNLFKLVTSSTAEESDIRVGNLINLNEDPVTQMLVEKGENLVLTEASTAPLYQVFVQTFTTRKKSSIILLPLLSRDEVVGYIFMEDPDENKTVDEEENDLFDQISAQVSTAVESARLFTAEQQGRMSAAALLEITQIASASLDINRVLNQATTRSAQAIQADRCTVLLLDPRQKIYPLVSIDHTGAAMDSEGWEHFQEKVAETYKQTSIRNLAATMRQPMIINDLESFTDMPMDWAAELETESMMSIPLISQNKVIGAMIYTQIEPDKSFQESQIDLAQTIAGQIATTIENANLFEQAVTRAERERQITEITAKIRSTNDPQQIMTTAVAELRAALAESTIKAKQAAQSRKPEKNKNGNESGAN